MKNFTDCDIPLRVKKDIEAITDTLSEKFGQNISRIVLFGSYATGKYQPDSDIDIAVVLNELPLPGERRAYMRAAECVERETDLLFCTKEQMESAAFVFKRINEQGVVLYEQL